MVSIGTGQTYADGVQTLSAIGAGELTTPTSSQRYALGLKVAMYDETYKSIKEFIYVKAAAALTAKDTVMVVNSNTSGAEYTTLTPATTATATRRCGVALSDVTINYYCFLQILGPAPISSTGAMTAGNTVVMANGVKTLTDSAGTTVGTATVGIALTSSLGAAANTVLLLGERVTV